MRLGSLFVFILLPLLSLCQESGFRSSSYFIDLGTAALNSTASFAFELRNFEKDTVRVKGIDVSCHCLSIDQYPKLVPPGDTAIVKGHFSSGTPGELFKYVIVHSKSENPYQKIGVKVRYK